MQIIINGGGEKLTCKQEGEIMLYNTQTLQNM